MDNQKQAISDLKRLAPSNIRSFVIAGPKGCGKTYLARMLSDMRRCEDFIYVDAKMQDIRDVMYNTETDSAYAICIENLDTAVPAVSQAILKYVETPKPNVTVIITCRRFDLIPDTIRSRCAVIEVSPMEKKDIAEYTERKYPEAYQRLSSKADIWSAVQSVSDVEWLQKLTDRQLEYIQQLYGNLVSASPINTITWKLTKFPDGSAVDPDFAVRYLMSVAKSPKVKTVLRLCLDDMDSRVPAHAALSNAVMIIKYGGIV